MEDFGTLLKVHLFLEAPDDFRDARFFDEKNHGIHEITIAQH